MTRRASVDVARRRLRNQFLVTTRFRDPADVVRALGAVQAQEYAQAKWALALRARGLTDANVEASLVAGDIVRTHVLRPTWHFVAPEDLRWMLMLTAPRVAQSANFNRRFHGLERAEFNRFNAELERELRGGRHRTRADLCAALTRAGHTRLEGGRVWHLFMQAELDGVVCSGARKGKQLTYALLDERVPPAPALQRDEALAELSRRYFATRGPATTQDFAWWSGLTVSDARRGAEAAAPAVRPEVIDGVTYYAGRESRARTPRAIAHLLPSYDEFFIGYRNRDAIAGRLRSAAKRVAVSGLLGQGVFVDGQLVGAWRFAKGKHPATVTLHLPLKPAERRLVDAEVARLATFLGR